MITVTIIKYIFSIITYTSNARISLTVATLIVIYTIIIRLIWIITLRKSAWDLQNHKNKQFYHFKYFSHKINIYLFNFSSTYNIDHKIQFIFKNLKYFYFILILLISNYFFNNLLLLIFFIFKFIFICFNFFLIFYIYKKKEFYILFF